ncbi:MAG: hypothetical protein FJZ89_13885 [Chloroflexi bacterium]|nr:hypothetical protein [Chloroflexota bacterium]
MVLGDGRAGHKGKGLTGVRSLHRQHWPDCRAGETMPTSLRAIAVSNAEASTPEEPGAIILHAGICAGAVG